MARFTQDIERLWAPPVGPWDDMPTTDEWGGKGFLPLSEFPSGQFKLGEIPYLYPDAGPQFLPNYYGGQINPPDNGDILKWLQENFPTLWH